MRLYADKDTLREYLGSNADYKSPATYVKLVEVGTTPKQEDCSCKK